MYTPPAFREDRLEVMHALIGAHPLAMLVTGGAGGLMASLVPFSVDPAASPKGTLRAHLAKANEQLAALASGAEAMVLFQGPQAYVTPSWYASKREHGKVVPTWNYVTVHAWGIPRLSDSADWLRRQVDHLTDAQEQGRAHPWAVADAPEPFVAGQLRNIMGLEIPIDRIEGAWKLSQNRSAADRQGVAEGMRGEGAAGAAVSRLVIERGG
jgi:transcriptional regulator